MLWKCRHFKASTKLRAAALAVTTEQGSSTQATREPSYVDASKTEDAFVNSCDLATGNARHNIYPLPANRCSGIISGLQAGRLSKGPVKKIQL